MEEEKKICKHCGIVMEILKSQERASNGSFLRSYKDSGLKYVSNSCRPCINKKKRESWSEDHRKKARQYEKTVDGFLMRTYRNMASRVSGVQKVKAHLYYGKEILDKKDFYTFSNNDESFLMLFEQWIESGYDRRLSPSIDRVDSDLGYSINNIRWMTHSENSRLGAISRHSS